MSHHHRRRHAAFIHTSETLSLQLLRLKTMLRLELLGGSAEAGKLKTRTVLFNECLNFCMNATNKHYSVTACVYIYIYNHLLSLDFTRLLSAEWLCVLCHGVTLMTEHSHFACYNFDGIVLFVMRVPLLGKCLLCTYSVVYTCKWSVCTCAQTLLCAAFTAYHWNQTVICFCIKLVMFYFVEIQNCII